MRRYPTYQGRPCPYGHPGIRYRANGSCKDCLQKRNTEYRRKVRERGRLNPPNPILVRRKQMFHFAQRRCIADNVSFTITLADVQIPNVCPILGIPMTHCTLIRLDLSRGYVPGNVVAVSTRGAALRSTATAHESRQVTAWIESVEARTADNWLD